MHAELFQKKMRTCCETSPQRTYNEISIGKLSSSSTQLIDWNSVCNCRVGCVLNYTPPNRDHEIPTW